MKYRISVDVDEKNAKLIKNAPHVGFIFMKRTGAQEILDIDTMQELEIEKDPFTSSEMSTILELARVALSDASDEGVYDFFVDKLDITDKEMKSLQKKIEKKTS